MIYLITGGSGSGKSDYAEQLLISGENGQRPLLYVATMIPADEETKEKIHRHRSRRAGKGFVTLECYRDLASLTVPENDGILLECVTNLTANELFSPDGTMCDPSVAASKVRAGVAQLAAQTERLILVTGEVGGDAGDYTEETEVYRALLVEINCTLAARADEVIEVVCGIPQIIGRK